MHGNAQMVRHQLNSFTSNLGKEAVAQRLAVGIPGGITSIGLDFTPPGAGERLLILDGEAKTVAQEAYRPASFPPTCCIGTIFWTTICYTTTYRLLGELGAAGLRAPPECVADPQPDLGNTSEGKASITADIYHFVIHASLLASMAELPLLMHTGERICHLELLRPKQRSRDGN